MPRSASQETVVPAVLVAGDPQVERRLGVVDPEAGGLERRAQRRTPGGVARVLLVDVRVVVERRHHRRLLRARASSGRGSCGPRAARRSRPGRRRRRRSGSRPGWSASTASARPGCPRGCRRRRRGGAPRPARALPDALDVALVGDQQHTALAAPVDDLRRWSTGSTRPVGFDGELSHSSRGVSGPERGQRVGGHGAGAGQDGADLVGRVGDLRVDHQVTGTDAEVARHRRDQLLGADDRQHAVEARAR